jgi:hypothetical protein
MMRLPPGSPDSPAVVAAVETLFAAAPAAGVDLFEVELARRRLVESERECQGLQRGRRRSELERLMLADTEFICRAILAMEQAADAAGV